MPDRTILITGGTGALGTTVTRRLLEEGHHVVVTRLEAEEAQATRDVSSSLMSIRADVTDPTSIQEAVDHARSHLGPIDGLVHLVGAWMGGAATHEHDVSDWNRMLAVNLTSAFLCSRAALPGMIERDQGRIVFVSSRTAHLARAGQVGYAVAKAGVEVLAQTIAEETRAYNVTANVIAPSTIDTPGNRRSMPDANFSSWVSLDDVAASISFLINDSGAAIRGATLPIYGGV
jgi:NAD(P)-dependent dehydrogenase (short-subunit alcohol dehydrogenase family)